MLGIDNRKEEMKEDSQVLIWTWKSFSGIWKFRGGGNWERHKGRSYGFFEIFLTEDVCDTSK